MRELSQKEAAGVSGGHLDMKSIDGSLIILPVIGGYVGSIYGVYQLAKTSQLTELASGIGYGFLAGVGLDIAIMVGEKAWNYYGASMPSAEAAPAAAV